MAANDFIASTDYAIDKVSGYKTGQVTIAGGGSAFPELFHDLGYMPLYFLKWSTDPDFNTSYDEVGVSTSDSLSCSAQTDVSKLYLFMANYSTSTRTFYYRVIFFMPPDINVQAAETTSALDDFNKNTDYNYTKIYEEDVRGAGNHTITHSLGYYPQVEVWYQRNDGRLIHLVENDIGSTPFTPTAQITPTQLILNQRSTTVTKWFYRIYTDET